MEKVLRSFETFKVKDIVFLAIISAVTLCTCAVMPLVASLQRLGCNGKWEYYLRIRCCCHWV